jgi:hypothetical protein
MVWEIVGQVLLLAVWCVAAVAMVMFWQPLFVLVDRYRYTPRHTHRATGWAWLK